MLGVLNEYPIVSGLCDPAIEDAIDRGARAAGDRPVAANRAWAALDHRLVDLAPQRPARSLGGVLLGQIWVR
jgi:hypothetical protein